MESDKCELEQYIREKLLLNRDAPVAIVTDIDRLTERFQSDFFLILRIPTALVNLTSNQKFISNQARIRDLMVYNDVLGGAYATLGKRSNKYAMTAAKIAYIQLCLSLEYFSDQWELEYRYLLYIADSLINALCSVTAVVERIFDFLRSRKKQIQADANLKALYDSVYKKYSDY